MARRRANGEGTIYRRKDGRYEGAAYFLTTSGKRKRVRVYSRTREEARDNLTAAILQAREGIRVPDQAWRLGSYLDYWLEQVVRTTRRPKTYELYEATVRLNLRPGLGTQPLRRLSVPIVQTFLNQQLGEGHSIRKVQVMRTVLSAALTRAHREELVTRNVARLVELPAWERREVRPWTADEATRFLESAGSDPLYPAFVLLVLYGLRRGEVLGLRHCDIDLDNGVLHVWQQLQRVDGSLRLGPVKTKAGRRDLPLLGFAREVLAAHYTSRLAAVRRPEGPSQPNDLIFTSRTGRPIEPRNLVRSFQRVCELAGVPIITVHHVRHTTATLLKRLGVSARDAQLILGHSQISVTQEIYQHDDMEDRRENLERVEALLLRSGLARPCTSGVTVDGYRSRQNQPSNMEFMAQITSAISGGPGGARTLDTLLKSSIYGSLEERVASVKAVAECRARMWLLGVAAVKTSRQIALPATPSTSGEQLGMERAA
jgi:integrase